MLVTLPCAMLLLDLWPLCRWTGAGPAGLVRLVAEKLPFFAFAAASCVLTSLAQSAGGAMKAIEYFPIPVRIANAFVAYALYLGKLFWPTDLAVLYPSFGEMPPAEHIVLAVALLAALSAAALLALRRRHAWVVVGWLWFLGTLVPVIGLVQVGGQTMADRYSYIPSIGVFLVIVWATAEAMRPLARRVVVLGIATGTALTTCAGLTIHQLAFWRNSETLFRHTVAVTENNWMAHFNLFVFYRRDPAAQVQAREEYDRALSIIGAFAERQNQRGLALLRQGHTEEAVSYFRKSIRVKKDHAPAHANLGLALLQTPDHLDEAIAAFRTALRLDPENAEAQLGLGHALARSPNRLSEAIAELRMAVWLLPDRADAHLAFADALAHDPSRRTTAIAEYEKVLSLEPASAEALASLARLQSVSQ
jgi:tetratricopeptide (TPR) repeat protein